MYSTSGLLKESQVDIVSSMETEFPSDRSGDTSRPDGTGKAAEATVERVPLFFGRDVSLQGKTADGFAFKEEDDVFPVTPTVRELLVDPFFALEILVAHGTFKKTKSLSQSFYPTWYKTNIIRL